MLTFFYFHDQFFVEHPVGEFFAFVLILCLHLVFIVYACYILDCSITSIITCFLKMSCKPTEIIIIRLQLASMLCPYVERQR